MSQSEFDIIRRYFTESGLSWNRSGIVLGIGDDAAILQPPAQRQLCLSMDVLVADVHFPAAANPVDIGYRALAVNLSDLAAMAAEPFCFSLGLTLPQRNEDWLAGFSAGLLELARRFDCPLIGGDLTRGPLSITIQVHGLSRESGLLRRDGASVGDLIYVSGYLGDGAIALASLGLPSHLGESFTLNHDQTSAASRRYFESCYYRPEPRLQLAADCAGIASSAIDISDGLLGDLGHITRASGVGAVLNLDQLPFSDEAVLCSSLDNRRQAALFGGDDYELCLTVAPNDSAGLEQAAASTGTALTRVGQIGSEPGVRLQDTTGNPVNFRQTAYDHFQHE